MLKPVRLFVKAAAPLLIGALAGLMAAQPGSPPLTCDPADLIARQAELAAALEAFETGVEADTQAALETLFQTGAAYQELALDCGYIPPDAAERFVGADTARIETLLAETGIMGDPLNGQLLYNSDTLACYGCHVTQAGEAAPALEGTYTRTEETRLADPRLAGYDIQRYLIESIVNPAAYVTPGYNNVMPNNFGERLTLQDLADLLFYLESQDGPSPE